LSTHVDDQGQLITINEQNRETIDMMKKSQLSAAVLAALTSTTLLSNAASAQEASDPNNVEIIQVRGIQSSLAKAMELKQNADGIQDSIVAEDIGKFPDQNAAESLQRITGVSISRANGEGSKVTVRGFGPKFNVIKVNDRTLSTTDGGRDFDFQTLASELISGIDVVKTPTSDLTAGSIGAYINIKTARPFDSPGFHALGSAKANYNDLSEETDPQFSGIISNTFADDSFGILFGITAKESNNRIDKYRTNRWHELYTLPEGLTDDVKDLDGNVIAADGFRRPGRAAFESHDESRKRTGANLVLQWAPTDEIVSTLDVLYSDLARESQSLGIQIPTQATQYNSAVINDNKTLIRANITDNNIDGLNRVLGEDSTSWAYGFNTLYEKDNLLVEFDAAYSTSESTQITREFIPHFTLPDAPENREITLDYGAGDVLNTTSTIDVNDIDGIRGHWNGASTNEIEDEVTELKLDTTYVLDGDLVDSVQFGVAYLDRTTSNDTFRLNNGGGHCTPCGGAPNVTFDNPEDIFGPSNNSGFLSEESGNFPRSWLVIKDFDAYVDAVQSIGEKSWYNDPVTGWRIDEVLGSPLLAPGQKWNQESFNAAPSYENEETTLSVYGRVNLYGELGDYTWSGNAGLRYIDIENTANGFSQQLTTIKINPSSNDSELRLDTTFTDALPVSENSDSQHLLPSLNLNLDLNDGLFLRTAVAQTISRPAISDTGVNRSINVDNTGQITTRSGNPFLEPYKVNQFDLSLEYYQENGNAYSIAYFYKDITDFISTQSNIASYSGSAVIDQDVLDRVSGGVLPETTTNKQNRSGGTVNGIELSALHYFDYLPGFLSGFGVQANYTYANSEDSGAEKVNQPGIREPGNALEGFAKNSYNLIAFYDQDGLQARVAYNWRDNFLLARDGAAGSIAATLPVNTDAYGQLDASISYDLNESFTLSAEAINLTDEGRVEYIDIRERVSRVEYAGVRYQLGVRARF
jgi:iron complex outermembrane receptor protein